MIADVLLVVGAGGHARACIDVVQRHGGYAIAGLVGTAGEVGSHVLGCEVLGTDDDLAALRERCPAALLAVGQIKSASRRVALHLALERLGFELPAIVSPAATVSRHAEIGAGTIVMNGAIVGAGVRIGRNCIVNSGALIEHDTIVEDHCHISTRATLNGGVRVGSSSFVGSGSVIKEGLVIGQDCVVGMGLSLRRDLPDGNLFVGQ